MSWQHFSFLRIVYMKKEMITYNVTSCHIKHVYIACRISQPLIRLTVTSSNKLCESKVNFKLILINISVKKKQNRGLNNVL